jgi:hypothetical protein
MPSCRFRKCASSYLAIPSSRRWRCRGVQGVGPFLGVPAVRNAHLGRSNWLRWCGAWESRLVGVLRVQCAAVTAEVASLHSGRCQKQEERLRWRQFWAGCGIRTSTFTKNSVTRIAPLAKSSPPQGPTPPRMPAKFGDGRQRACVLCVQSCRAAELQTAGTSHQHAAAACSPRPATATHTNTSGNDCFFDALPAHLHL